MKKWKKKRWKKTSKKMGALGANVMIIRRANVGDISGIIFLVTNDGRGNCG